MDWTTIRTQNDFVQSLLQNNHNDWQCNAVNCLCIMTKVCENVDISAVAPWCIEEPWSVDQQSVLPWQVSRTGFITGRSCQTWPTEMDITRECTRSLLETLYHSVRYLQRIERDMWPPNSRDWSPVDYAVLGAHVNRGVSSRSSLG